MICFRTVCYLPLLTSLLLLLSSLSRVKNTIVMLLIFNGNNIFAPKNTLTRFKLSIQYKIRLQSKKPWLDLGRKCMLRTRKEGYCKTSLPSQNGGKVFPTLSFLHRIRKVLCNAFVDRIEFPQAPLESASCS